MQHVASTQLLQLTLSYVRGTGQSALKAVLRLRTSAINKTPQRKQTQPAVVSFAPSCGEFVAELCSPEVRVALRSSGTDRPKADCNVPFRLNYERFWQAETGCSWLTVWLTDLTWLDSPRLASSPLVSSRVIASWLTSLNVMQMLAKCLANAPDNATTPHRPRLATRSRKPAKQPSQRRLHVGSCSSHNQVMRYGNCQLLLPLSNGRPSGKLRA